MADSRTKRSRPVRTLVALTILTIVVPFLALGAGVFFDGESEENPAGAGWAPELALDLQGGTQVVLTPVTTDGSQVTDETVAESINVIRQRIDSSGVTEAEITSQGAGNIVVGIPGEVDQATIDLVSEPAQMRFRPVLTYDMGTPTPQEGEGAGDEGAEGGEAPADEAPADEAPADEAPADEAPADEAPADEGAADEGAADEGAADEGAADEGAADEGTGPSGKSAGSAVPAPADADPAPTATATAGTDDPSPEPTDGQSGEQGDDAGATDASDLAQITPEIQEQFDQLDCSDPANLTGGGGDDPDEVLVTCSEDGQLKYILGPMEVDGTRISSASSGLIPGQGGTTTNEWGVFLNFDSQGAVEFREISERLVTLEQPRDQFGIVLDGLVVSAPQMNDPITNGQATISGNFTQESAATLANQLSFGALPINFDVQSQEEISATLGSEQLRNGMLAGLIGLALVVVYSLFQYRTLGLLTVGSLVVAGLMTYLAIAILSWTMGYRLSLAGVAGLIVAIGFTADSFIVYFERIRDEVRDGRTLSYAVERGWARARRTVLAAKTVNLISAIILYFLAVGGVQGFAFTLGLTTIIDVMVVFWFTHPMMEVLTRMPFFRDGHRWSGLSPERLRSGSGPRYAGAGRVRMPEPAVVGAPASGSDADVAAPGPEPAGAGPATAAPAASSAEARVGGAASTSGVPTTDASGRRLTIAERRAAARKAAAQEAPPEGLAPGDPESAGHVTADENEENR